MEEDGVLVPVAVSGQPDRYELAEIAASHHHHFHCTVCDRMFDVDGCVGKLAGLLPKGFTLEDHELTLRGRCESCVIERQIAHFVGNVLPAKPKLDA